MRDSTRHNGPRWRITAPLAVEFGVPPSFPAHRIPALAASTECAGHDEEPGADGIRHGLVARIRQEIAAGTYDTEEKWLAAEEALLRRVEERM